MNQDEIFKLLLIILLLANEHNPSETVTRSGFACLNEIIIIVLLLNAFNNPSRNIDNNNFPPVTTF